MCWESCRDSIGKRTPTQREMSSEECREMVCIRRWWGSGIISPTNSLSSLVFWSVVVKLSSSWRVPRGLSPVFPSYLHSYDGILTLKWATHTFWCVLTNCEFIYSFYVRLTPPGIKVNIKTVDTSKHAAFLIMIKLAACWCCLWTVFHLTPTVLEFQVNLVMTGNSSSSTFITCSQKKRRICSCVGSSEHLFFLNFTTSSFIYLTSLGPFSGL